MTRLMHFMRHLGQFICTLLMLLGDGGPYSSSTKPQVNKSNFHWR